MKKNVVKHINHYYVGGCDNRRKNGRGKNGISQQHYLSKRIAKIRETEKDFVVFGHMIVFDIDKSDIEALEADVKSHLTKYDFLRHVQNDHFEMKLSSDRREYVMFAGLSLLYAKQYCDMRGWEYEIDWPY